MVKKILFYVLKPLFNDFYMGYTLTWFYTLTTFFGIKYICKGIKYNVFVKVSNIFIMVLNIIHWYLNYF